MQLSQETLRQFRYAFARKVTDLDPYNRVIGYDDLPGEFAASECSVLFAGPPTVALARKNQDLLTPIGLVQNISYNGQKNITPIPEMGNKTYRYVPGRTIHSANIGRLLARSGSLLYNCYSWLEKFMGTQAIETFVPPGDSGGLPDVVGRHWTTLESDLFNIPTGLLLVIGNSNGEVLWRVYWEKCMIPEHVFQIQSSETPIIESVGIRMSRAVPIHGINVNLTGGAKKLVLPNA